MANDFSLLLKTRLFGNVPEKIHFFESTDSTNLEAARRAAQGGVEGEIFIADAQSAGRGRMDRIWESPAGKNLYLSFLLKPAIEPAKAVAVTLVAGVAVHETLNAYLPWAMRESLKIKWPNDIYLKGRKIAGILTEMETCDAKVVWVVAGIGINLNSLPEDFSPALRAQATSILIETGSASPRGDVARDLITNFEKTYAAFLEHGPGGLIAFCNEHSYLRGKPVKVTSGQDSLEGIAQGLDDHGFLVVTTPDGEKHTILSGDVILEVSA